MATGRWRRGDLVLGLYEVREVLEGGGMGLVYRVRHRSWNTDLAVKVPRPELVATAAGRGGFEREAGTWVGLGLHPHVVACLYVRQVDAVPCVFAEWVPGGSLAELVRDGRLYARGGDGLLARLLDLAVQMARGIGHAHEQGLIHQDVKPANIMVDPTDGWTAKVTDFGLAGARAAAGESALAPPQASLLASFGGMTPAYCSPEQADAVYGAPVTLTRATDIWSWALSVLEMFTGGPPCEYGQSAPEVLAAFVASGRPAPGAPAMPTALADLLMRCFEVDRDRRPRCMDEIAAAVAEIYQDAVGRPYPRVPAQAVRLLADSLSNQALSLLDLDRAQEAEGLWGEARDIDPHHLPTVYNQSLYRWRRASFSDEDVLSGLRTAKALGEPGQEADRLLGLVQVERGDDTAARALLADAPDGPEVQAARAELSRRGPARRPERLTGHQGEVRAVAVNAAGTVVLTGGADGRARVWDTATGRCRYELPPGAAGALHDDPVPVTAVAVAPDGRAGLVGHRYGPVELWDLTAGTLLGTIGQRGPEIVALALNGSGGAAVTYRTGQVEVWDARAGRLRRTLEHPPASHQKMDPDTWQVLPRIHYEPALVSHVALAEDGSTAVSAAPRSGSVVTWDIAQGRPLHQLVMSADRHSTGIDEVALSPGGTAALLLGRWSTTARIWECATDRVRATVPDQIGRHDRVVLSDDATIAASASLSGTEPLRIWELSSGRCLHTISTQIVPSTRPDLPVPLSLTSLALSGDGRLAVLGDREGGIQIHRLAPAGFRAGWHYGRPAAALALARREVDRARFAARATALAEQGDPAAAAEQLRAARAVPGFERHPELRRQWEELGRAAGRRTGLLGIWDCYSFSGTVLAQNVLVAPTPDGTRMVIPGAFGRVHVCDLATGRVQYTFPEVLPGNTHTVAVADDGLLAVTADWAGTAHLWDLDAGTRSCELHGDHGLVRALAMDPAGRYALVGDEDGALCLWRLRPAFLQRTMVGHDGAVRLVRLSPDARYAASVGREDGTGRLWDTGTGRPLLAFPVAFGNPDLRFTPDSRRLFVYTGFRMSVWDVRGRRLLYERDGHSESFALSADGGTAATAGTDGTLEVWETGSGRTVCEVPWFSHLFEVSPDGRHVVSASDRALHVWDVRTGQRVHTLEGHPEAVCLVMFAADGRHLISADHRPGLRLWELDYDYDFTAERTDDT
ncbi:protein kinase [Streptomyces sp. RPA4-2]|uniref:WD40 repeat domain-containing serine/threonine protein kinase n=1 Tax=Streptomyces sp. RPA4-2 TaxID=2721244 RepID=UPI00143ED9FB|nr:protein kinase [Streptomyces sp. RPA4-2]QIY66468.1 protein kinase [Streptomyces sp. RPA4-2]